ncbi:hypothetical protein [Vibrio methylphosphonaticus]|uniref:hypothetical protein n=1 Tax=Vibrio methylphosphonaticus TaxID=2946866 RepID=UPI00202AB7D1|nr:hypothetical protein [Vibrio methylphosphonaticus]MCL9777582.1 hypothetical protein [Vibrio methylphosphonaticus]
MIVELCESVYRSIEDGSSDATTFLDDLLLARRNGFISLLLSKKDILKLIGTLDLNGRQRSILNFDKENSTFINPKLKSFGNTIKCYDSRYTGSGDYDIFDYQNKVQDNDYLPITKASVVFENKDDDLVYRKIIDWYFCEKNISTDLQVSYEAIHGGGDTTSTVSEKCINTRVGVYGICDSDKVSPHDMVGGTARKTKKVFDDNGLPSSFLCIEAHEVENLVPFAMHEKTAIKTQMPAIDFIKYSRSKCSESYLYYDFKDSIKKELIISESKCGKYWKDIIEGSIYEGSLEKIEVNHKIVCKLSSLVHHSIKAFNKEVDIEPGCQSLYKQWCAIGEFLTPRVVASKPYKM